MAQAALHEVHFVDEAEDFGGGGAFVEGPYDVGVGDYVGGEFAGFDVEDED